MSVNFVNLEKAALDLAKQGRLSEACALVERFASDPATNSSPDVFFHLGQLANNLGDGLLAERYLRLVIERMPANHEANYQLGLALMHQGKLEQSLLAFDQAIKIKPDYGLAQLHSGLILSNLGKMDDALLQFESATRSQPTLAAAQYQAGLIKARKNDISGAQSSLRQAISQVPDFVPALQALGALYISTRQFDAAAQCFVQLLKIEPTLASAHSNLAFVMACKREYSQALEHCRQALNKGGNDFKAQERALVLNNWGVALYQLGDSEAALEKFRECTAIDAENVEACLNMCLTSISLSEYEMAQVLLEDILSKYPHLPAANLYLAVVSVLRGQYDLALKALNCAIENGLSQMEVSMWFGYAFLGLAQNEDARRHFEMVCKDTPKNYLSWYGLALSFICLKNYKQAISALKRSLEIAPGFSQARIHLSNCLRELGDDAAARKESNQAYVIDPRCLVQQCEMVETFLRRFEPELAVCQAVKVLDLVPKNLDAQLSLARALMSSNRLDEAFHLCQLVLEQAPRNVHALTLSGQVKMAQGNLLEADETFRQAVQLNDPNCEATLYFSWARTLAFLGLPELALANFAKASELDPSDGSIYEHWGSALKNLGRLEEAKEVFRRASELI